MKNLKTLLFVILLLPLFTACDFITNVFTYKDSTAEFIDSVIKEDYDKSLDCLDFSGSTKDDKELDSIRIRLTDFRKYLVDRFGTEIEYSFLRAQKTRSTIDSQNTPEGATDVFIQINNDKYFGVLQLLFEDESGKIIKADVLNMKEEIPSMPVFWLVGLIAICVPIFNIYMVVRIRRSSLKKKWIKYLAIILLNLPTIGYTAIGALYLNILSAQFLFGISFSILGYASSYWAIGLPLGGIYWYWRLAERKRLAKDGIDLDNDISTKEDVAD